MNSLLRLCVVALAVVGCGPEFAVDDEELATSESELAARSFTFVTYNVHGMPDAVTSRKPKADMPLISPKLNAFDAVVVQKDFVYHDELVAQLSLPHRTTQRGTWYDLGDGLNAFSRFPLRNVVRDGWDTCHGYVGHRSDCLAPKGNMKVTMELAPGVLVDVYDIHMDAGRSEDDIEARERQVTQLLGQIARTSPADRAIIVAGDTSMRASDEATLQRLLREARLVDVCRALGCAEPARVNRIMFRNGARVQLRAREWKAVMNFVNARGEQLSDQEPVMARLSWRVVAR
jgi:hypothetical protein